MYIAIDHHLSRQRPVGRAFGPGTDDPCESGAAVPGPRTVLVVDDQQDLADMAEMLLSSYGMEVRVAYSAEDALAILRADSTIEAVFSDIAMPGMSGLQLAGLVGSNYPHIKVVLTSGYTHPELLAARRDSVLFVTKPYSIDKVVDLLRQG
ncbi:response regulator [Oxalobacteraceae bacterium OTU3REALA1]|nr:response regulator [Oxalobacteraceae bacterium OTU3REALA1]